tara:strand:- start:64 stop:1020 length:957 start_codon:yes stop_codon:yes gene_type:complete
MACENCENGCADPNLCACDCQSCAEANGCDIPVGDIGPSGPAGPAGQSGQDGQPGVNGEDGANGCSVLNIYVASGGETVDSGFAVEGDLVIETGPAPSPCNQTYIAGNITNILEESTSNTLPVGVIVMWSGSVSSINDLPGWAICDGTSGTPDLRGRFIVMPDQSAGAPMLTDANNNPLWPNVGDTGGDIPFTCLAPNNIPAHVHDLDGVDISLSQGGAHYHQRRGYYVVDGTGSPAEDVKSRGRIGSDPMENVTAVPFDGTGDCTGDNDPNCGAHIHDVSLDGDTGDGQPELGSPDFGDCFNHIPPYYALCFIMKIS